MQTTVRLVFAGSALEVVGYHIPGEGDTNTAEQFEVSEVYRVGDRYHEDLSELLGEDRCKEIAEAIVNREGM